MYTPHALYALSYRKSLFPKGLPWACQHFVWHSFICRGLHVHKLLHLSHCTICHVDRASTMVVTCIRCYEAHHVGCGGVVWFVHISYGHFGCICRWMNSLLVLTQDGLSTAAS